MCLRINLSVPPSGCDRLIYISLFPVILNLKMLWLLVLFSLFWFIILFCFWYFWRTVLPHFQNNKTRVFFSIIYRYLSVCHSLPADYFTLHWALYMQDKILIWDSVASLAVFIVYSYSRLQFGSARCFSGKDSVHRIYRGWYPPCWEWKKKKKKKRHATWWTCLSTVLQYINGNSGISRGILFLVFALHSKWYSNEKLNQVLYCLVN